MNSDIVYLVLISLVLWFGAFRLRNAARELKTDSDSEFREECYHYLVDIARIMAGELHTLRLLLDGRTGITPKQAAKIALATPGDGQRWDIRIAALLVLERMNRLGQAVQLEIFDIDAVWDSNGELLLATDRRIRNLFDETQQINPKLFATYTYLIDELQSTAMKRRAKQLS